MDNYKTTELMVASFLAALGFTCKIESVPGAPGRCAFVFDGAAGERVEDFYGGEKVDAYRLLLCEKELKGRVMNRIRPMGRMPN